MPLIDDILAFDRARASGGAARGPAPSVAIVIVASSELVTSEPGGGIAARLGLAPEDTVLVVVPGARVQRSDGEVARAVCLAAAWEHPAEIVVVCGDDSPFRSPSFGVPGPTPSGEAFSSAGELVRHSVAQLRSSPWLPRGTVVNGLVVLPSGRLECVTSDAAHATGISSFAASSVSSPINAPGPVTFFGSGPVKDLLATPTPLNAPPTWKAPSPLQGPVGFTTPGPAPSLGSPAPIAQSLADTPPAPIVPPLVAPGMTPPSRPSITFERESQPRAPSRPQPRGAPPEPPPLPTSQPSEAPPAAGDDPFDRAEKILERLRKERRGR